MERYAGHILLDIVSTPEEVRQRLNRPDLRDAYDALLLDYMLPGLNALELLKEINEQYSLRVPVILVTGYGGEDIAIQATRMGAADYVVKTSGYLFKLPLVIENAYHRIELAREQAALRTAESRYRDLVEKNPGVLYIDTPTLPTSTLFISKQIQAISGFTSEEWTQDPDLWRSLVHPEDRDAYLALEAACNDSGQPFRMEYRLVRRDGEIIWLRDEAVLMLDADGNRLYWQGLLLDITAERQAVEAIRRRDAILGALSLAAENMLKQPWEDCIQQVLEDLGQAANASRSYLYQVHSDPDGKVFSTLIHEWVAGGIGSVIQSPDRTDFDMTERGLQRWVDELSARRPIFGVVSELAETERAVLEETDVLSLVVVPIFVRQKLWGLWGFTLCHPRHGTAQRRSYGQRQTSSALQSSACRTKELFSGS
jgi:PAS domain S-box-containing protein